MAERKFYETMIVVKVLSEDEPIDSSDLANVAYQITEGDYSGVVASSKSEQLTAKEAAEALIAQGSDPEFFRLDSEGNEIES